ncbi:MAG: ABC transporter substrate-binding protein [Treponema sp.]|nr:ABC transporter substrate-binding protein [Treponema sp.]
MKKFVNIIGVVSMMVSSLMCLNCAKKKVSDSNSYKLTQGKQATSAFISPLVQIADEQGFLAEYNLKVETQIVDRSGAFEAVAAGKLDFLTFELVPHLSYGAQGADEILFGGTLTGGMAVMANKNVADEVRDIKNWKGKTIGVKLLSTSELVSKYVLREEYGFKIDDEVKYKFYDSNEPLIAAVSKGAVDIAFVSASYVESAESQGVVYLFPEVDLQKDYVCCRQVANGTAFKNNQEAFKRLLKGEIRAYKIYIEDENLTVASITRATHQDEDYVRRTYYSPETSQGARYNPDPNFNGVLGDYQILLDWDYVPKGLELHNFYNISLYADALKEVIAEFPDEQFYKDMWNYFIENNNQYPDFDKTYKAI